MFRIDYFLMPLCVHNHKNMRDYSGVPIWSFFLLPEVSVDVDTLTKFQQHEHTRGNIITFTQKRSWYTSNRIMETDFFAVRWF